MAFAGEGELVAEVRGELLHRAVENVVRNAVQHTAPGTTVEVTARPSATAPALLVTVADRGPGVAETELETIFEPFYRGARGQPGRGFGLGLAIARRAASARKEPRRRRPGDRDVRTAAVRCSAHFLRQTASRPEPYCSSLSLARS